MIFLLSTQSPELMDFFGIEGVVPCDEIGGFLGRDMNLRIGTTCMEGIPENYPAVDTRTDWFHRDFKPEPLDIDFFSRSAKRVAIDLLGKLLVVGDVAGIVVETEAYYGDKDPASRAYRGMKEHNKGMWLPGGHIFIYMVHANWMLNITTGADEPQAVLIRAVEPIAGIGEMRRRRGRKLRELCSGPGKLSQAFGICREMNGSRIGEYVTILNSPWEDFQVGTSHRIGVSRDLEEHMRFFVLGNPFISRK